MLAFRATARLARALGPTYGARLQEMILRVTMASAALGVTRPVRFAGNELFGRRQVGAYRLRRSGARIFVRHPMADAWVVHEVLNRGVYRPPGHVLDLLASRERPLRIVDLGAHVGSTALMMLELFPDAHVTAFEPSPGTAALLRRTIAANGLGAQCEVCEVAAGAAPGSAQIEGYSLLSHLVRQGEETEMTDVFPFLHKFQDDTGGPRAVEVVDVFPVLGEADLVKIDIEGAEWDILSDPRLAELPIAAMVLEYHPQGSPTDDAFADVRSLLGAAGFEVGEPFDVHDGVGVVWAWREDDVR